MVAAQIGMAVASSALQAFANAQKERAARKDFQTARSRSEGIYNQLYNDPALQAARQSTIQDINQPEGISQGAQRQMLSTLRGTVAGQQAGQVRGLNEDMARRGLLGSSTELSNRQALAGKALGQMAQGRQQLSLESEQQRQQKLAQARQQALGVAGTGISARNAASGSLGAQTGGLAALLGKFYQPGDAGKAAQGGAKLATQMFGGP